MSTKYEKDPVCQKQTHLDLHLTIQLTTIRSLVGISVTLSRPLSHNVLIVHLDIDGFQTFTRPVLLQSVSTAKTVYSSEYLPVVLRN